MKVNTEGGTHQMLNSTKKVIELKELIGERYFTLPRSMANEIDLVTGEPVIYVGINGKSTYIPVERPATISYPVFCTLKDLGILTTYQNYDDGGDIV